jgi:hypothetical protein
MVLPQDLMAVAVAVLLRIPRGILWVAVEQECLEKELLAQRALMAWTLLVSLVAVLAEGRQQEQTIKLVVFMAVEEEVPPIKLLTVQLAVMGRKGSFGYFSAPFKRELSPLQMLL